MNTTRSNFLKAILAAFAAPLAWLVPRPEVVEPKPMDLGLDKIEDLGHQGRAGQILVYDGHTIQWQYVPGVTSSSSSSSGGTTSYTVWE